MELGRDSLERTRHLEAAWLGCWEVRGQAQKQVSQGQTGSDATQVSPPR